MPGGQVIETIIESVYESAVDARDLGALNAVLANAFDAPLSGLIQLGEAPVPLASTGADVVSDPAYAEYYHTVDPWLAVGLSLPLNGPTAVDRYVSHDAFINSEFYTDFARHHGRPEHCLGIMFEAGATRYSFTAMRERAQGAFGVGDEHRMSALLPHVRRAIAIHDRQVAIERAKLEIEQLVEDDRYAVIIVGPDLDVRWRSRSCRDCDPTGLRFAADALGRVRLGFHDASLDARLKLAVAAACAPRLAEAGVVPTGAGHWVFVSPHVVDGRALARIRVPLVHVILSHGVQHAKGHFALTGAEAALCAALGAGRTMEAHAGSTGISVWTARTHLKNVFAKTGVTRQSDLVALLHQMSG